MWSEQRRVNWQAGGGQRSEVKGQRSEVGGRGRVSIAVCGRQGRGRVLALRSWGRISGQKFCRPSRASKLQARQVKVGLVGYLGR